ncbi:hypothetical protein RSAG8_13758, partial [Rhizoctonia solani AG-8 WAC10335]
MNHIWEHRECYFPLIFPGSPVHTVTWTSGVEDGVHFHHAESHTGVLIFAVPGVAWTTILPTEIQESVLALVS